MGLPKALTREAALVKLAQKYFCSHGPATVADFSWWSGLSAREARQALEMVKSNLVSETVDSQTYWFPGNVSVSKPDGSHPFLIPAYDEYIISYKDRSALFPYRYHHKLISENGIFRPTILVDGQVRGMWKRTIKKDKAILEIDLFESPDDTLLNLVEKACEPFGRFLDKQPEYHLIRQ